MRSDSGVEGIGRNSREWRYMRGKPWEKAGGILSWWSAVHTFSSFFSGDKKTKVTVQGRFYRGPSSLFSFSLRIERFALLRVVNKSVGTPRKCIDIFSKNSNLTSVQHIYRSIKSISKLNKIEGLIGPLTR